MGSGEPQGRLSADAQDLLEVRVTDSVDPLFQGHPRDVLHDDVRDDAGILNGVYDHDVFMSDGGRRSRFPDEPFTGGVAVRQKGSKHLDGNDAVQFVVESLEHHAHAAPADNFQDLEMVHAPQRPDPGSWLQEVERLIRGGVWSRAGLGPYGRVLVGGQTILGGGRRAKGPCAVARLARIGEHTSAVPEMSCEEFLDLAASFGIASASRIQISSALALRLRFQGSKEQGLNPGRDAHGLSHGKDILSGDYHPHQQPLQGKTAEARLGVTPGSFGCLLNSATKS
jgi:hypothetical protein